MIQPGTQWSGNPQGQQQDPDRCIITVGGDTLWGPANAHQCSRPRGHGYHLQYCRQHARMDGRDRVGNPLEGAGR